MTIVAVAAAIEHRCLHAVIVEAHHAQAIQVVLLGLGLHCFEVASYEFSGRLYSEVAVDRERVSVVRLVVSDVLLVSGVSVLLGVAWRPVSHRETVLDVLELFGYVIEFGTVKHGHALSSPKLLVFVYALAAELNDLIN